ncbi:hypothetical protein HZH66_004292 [Vespula vulgaris]|uniref:Uncharacterized protein n=1 Tax=Vespula vulgaris TaxID=7454 RepID=A0A834KGI2_VESVU|nr:hypothetical protein HZH66_004292 [Vespula vulgaris]
MLVAMWPMLPAGSSVVVVDSVLELPEGVFVLRCHRNLGKPDFSSSLLFIRSCRQKSRVGESVRNSAHAGMVTNPRNQPPWNDCGLAQTNPIVR